MIQASTVARAVANGPETWVLLLFALLLFSVVVLSLFQLRKAGRVARVNKRRARALRVRAETYATEPDTRPLSEALHLYQQRQKTETPLMDRLLGRPKSIEQAIKTRLATSAPHAPE